MPICGSFVSLINQKLFYFCKKNAHAVNPDSYREVDMRKLIKCPRGEIGRHAILRGWCQ